MSAAAPHQTGQGHLRTFGPKGETLRGTCRRMSLGNKEIEAGQASGVDIQKMQQPASAARAWILPELRSEDVESLGLRGGERLLGYRAHHHSLVARSHYLDRLCAVHVPVREHERGIVVVHDLVGKRTHELGVNMLRGQQPLMSWVSKSQDDHPPSTARTP